MNTCVFKIVVFASVGLAMLSAEAVCSKAADPDATPKLDHIEAQSASGEAKERGPLENLVKLSKPDDDRQVAIAGLLRSQPTPPVRASYFQSVLTNPELRFKRWHIEVLDVKSVEGMTRVKVRATVMLASTARVHGFLDESYETSGDELKLLKTEPTIDPKVVKQFTITRK